MANRDININFGLPPPPGIRNEQFYDDTDAISPPPHISPAGSRSFRGDRVRRPRRQQEISSSPANRPQRRVTFSASTEERSGVPDEPALPHTHYSPNRVLGLGGPSASNSPVFYYQRRYRPDGPAHTFASTSSPYYSLYSSATSPYYACYGTSRYGAYTTTSTATASNLAGPGRNLGKLYSFLGRRLEALMSFVAVSLGYGPDATALRLELAVKEIADDVLRGRKVVPRKVQKRRRKLHKECVRLLEYTDAREFTTQFNALTRLLHITSIPQVPDCDIALDALTGVQALQWMQTLRRSIQRKSASSKYAPEEYRQLRNLQEEVTRLLAARATLLGSGSYR